MSLDETLTALEERIARLMKEADELSDEVARQGREIARLRAQVDMLLGREAERDYDGGGTLPLADRKPPHW